MITLYTTNCPKCKVLKKKLDRKNIEFKEETDVKKMIEMKIISVPWLEVNGEMMDFEEANEWINNQ